MFREQTRNPELGSFHTTNVVPIERIRAQPGTWTVAISIDDQPAGRHSFQLEGPRTDPGSAPAVFADRPELKIGDRWAFSDGLYELVRNDGDVLVFSLGRTIQHFRTPAGHLIKRVRDGETAITYDPPFSHVQWPLSVGKHWTYEGDVVNKLSGFSGRAQSVIRVERYEDVETPAGTFKAFKIVTGSSAWWYSPDVRTIIKLRTSGVSTFITGRRHVLRLARDPATGALDARIQHALAA
jgi:hypothetical protein